MNRKLDDIMSTSIHRPLNASDKVSISELARYTLVNNHVDEHYLIECEIRLAWMNEVDAYSDMNYISDDGFRVAFLDGSYLTASK